MTKEERIVELKQIRALVELIVGPQSAQEAIDDIDAEIEMIENEPEDGYQQSIWDSYC
jgi:hypothetical protein